MDLSIIILSYWQKGLLKYCLKNLLALKLPLNYEIIVVDNAADKGLQEMLESEFMSVKLVVAKANRGFSAGNNLGLAKAEGKYLLILNPDVAILSNAILQLYQFLEERPAAGLIGPKVKNPDGSLQATCLRFPDWKLPFFRRTFFSKTKSGRAWNSRYLMLDWSHDQAKKVDWLFGACLMAKRTALSQVGLLDERYFLYLEDLDWCRRFWENHWEVWYLPEAEVIHYHQRLSAEVNILGALFSKTARIHLLSWFKYCLKFKGKALPKVD